METKFGTPEAIKSDTPQWAKWMFRGTIIVTTVITFVIASDPSIDDGLKVRIGVYLKALDMLVLGFSKMFGVPVEDEIK